MATNTNINGNGKRIPHFTTVLKEHLPKGRKGKHKEIVSRILMDLDHLKAGSAIKIPLSDLPESKEKVRSALNRETRKHGRFVATSSDDAFLYIWNATS